MQNIKIPETFMGKNCKEEYEKMMKEKEELEKPKQDLESKSKPDTNDFIYVPSISLYVAKQRTFQNKNWFDCHKELQKNNQRMLIIPEFIEFLKYLKSSINSEYLTIYKDITEVKDPWRAEWLDADLKVKNKQLYINYNHVLDSKGNLIPKNSELLDKDTLMKDKKPGISLDEWLDNHTIPGLPTTKTKSGDLYYWCPGDNNSVVGFDADSARVGLDCNGGPSFDYSVLGVRGVKK